MRTTFLAAALFALASVTTPYAAAQCTPGPHSETITADQTWCLADSPHVLSGVVTVAAGATLTIEAGSTVKPAAITVRGHLAAVGTATGHGPLDRIRLTVAPGDIPDPAAGLRPMNPPAGTVSLQ